MPCHLNLLWRAVNSLWITDFTVVTQLQLNNNFIWEYNYSNNKLLVLLLLFMDSLLSIAICDIFVIILAWDGRVKHIYTTHRWQWLTFWKNSFWLFIQYIARCVCALHTLIYLDETFLFYLILFVCDVEITSSNCWF